MKLFKKSCENATHVQIFPKVINSYSANNLEKFAAILNLTGP